MDGGKKAHYYCPEGYELMLAGGGQEDCTGRCYRPGSAKAFEQAVSAIMREQYKTLIHDADVSRAYAAFEANGNATVMTNDGKLITLRTPKGKSPKGDGK